MISCRNLCLTIKNHHILKNINLDLKPASFTAVIGPNGAGKSSLLKCLMGFHPKHTGHIKLNDRELHHHSRKDLARQLSYVPQVSGYFPAYSVLELVLMSRYIHQGPFGKPSAKDLQIAKDALEEVSCQALSNRLVSTLSGGERQKVLLAAALAQEPTILVLDEPLTYLDPRHQSHITQVLANLHHQHQTIIAATHDLALAIGIADHVLALRDGHSLYYGPAEQLIPSGVLRDLFDLEFDIVTHPTTGKPIPLPREVA